MLDEPTNDLDIETLELLEEVLLEFKGTILLVSHDRDFMDRVVTSLLVINELGEIEEQAGNFSDWESRGGALQSIDARMGCKGDETQSIETSTDVDKPETKVTPTTQAVARKLSYKETRELESLPDRIAHLEAEQATLEATTTDPSFFAGDSDGIAKTLDRLTEVSASLDEALERLIELEG